MITLKRGQSTAIEVPFKGNPQPVVSWVFNGDKELPDKKRMEVQTIRNMTTCRIGKVVRTDAGEYTLKLSNNVGKATLNITLNVLGKYLILPLSFLLGLTFVCSADHSLFFIPAKTGNDLQL